MNLRDEIKQNLIKNAQIERKDNKIYLYSTILSLDPYDIIQHNYQSMPDHVFLDAVKSILEARHEQIEITALKHRIEELKDIEVKYKELQQSLLTMMQHIP